jgi:hypothetical protein
MSTLNNTNNSYSKVFTFFTRNKEESKSVFTEFSKDIESVYRFYTERNNEVLYVPIIDILENDHSVKFNISYNKEIILDMKTVDYSATSKSYNNEIIVSGSAINIASAFSGVLKAIVFMRGLAMKETNIQLHKQLVMEF